MLYVYSPNGTTIDRTLAELPAEHWVQDTPTTGRYLPVDEANRESFGYYVLAENARPDADHIRSIANPAPGQFVEEWTFDQATAVANADQVDRDARRSELVAEGIEATLTAATQLASRAATFTARADATTNATALALINDLKNLVIPEIAAALVSGMRRDVKIVRALGLDRE